MRWRKPATGELVIFNLGNSKEMVKRVSAVAGESYQMKDGKVGIVPADHVFVLGDHSVDSYDSRVFGPIPVSCVSGRVRLVWASLEPAGKWRAERAGLWLR